MLVIYVISAVIVFIIYTGVKLKLEEWFEETKYVTVHMIVYDFWGYISLLLCFLGFLHSFCMTFYEYH